YIYQLFKAVAQCQKANDNPSSFTFFFDTSRHQHCYLAPERFLSSVDYEITHKEKGDEWLFGKPTYYSGATI
ncbi:hypothetical protein NECAME_18884, partial [Necator americanus]